LKLNVESMRDAKREELYERRLFEEEERLWRRLREGRFFIVGSDRLWWGLVVAGTTMKVLQPSIRFHGAGFGQSQASLCLIFWLKAAQRESSACS
jgi:hypothetical protein